MKELWWIILLMLFLVVLWISQGKSPGEGPFLTPPYISSPFDRTTETNSTDSRSQTGNGDETEIIKNISLSARSTKTTDPEKEYLEIKADRKNTENIVITGWKLKSSRTGNTATIRTGAKLAYSGRTNVQRPISLAPGEKAYIISGKSPIGTSFGLNICSGYFNQFQKFTPSISNQCPHPKELAPLTFTNACLDYIEDLPKCRMITSGSPLSINSECAAFASQHFSYSGCIKDFKNQSNFFKGIWMIYLNREQQLWPEKRETITLFDQNGEEITRVSY